jgi:predicted TIM-barrel fold metal-dependent hydrolase
MDASREFEAIYRHVGSLPAFSDHDHHQPDAFFADGMSLDKVLAASHVARTFRVPDGTEASREALLDHARFNSCFAWLDEGIQTVHGIAEPITLESWERISARIERAYGQDPNFHWKALEKHGYERLVVDAPWNPGDDNGHGEIFVPAFRIDKFMYGHHAEAVAPDDFVPWARYGFHGGTLDDYVALMRATIQARHSAGKVVALKCAEACHRPITFTPDDREAAERVFGLHPSAIPWEWHLLFGNYIFNRCCELAAELDVPFQVHTGLAQLSGSQPIHLIPIIERYPKTRFVLLHAGFPWTHQVAGLAHNYPNVYPSLTGAATVCTSAAARALHDFIDVTPSINTITWGSDCGIAEESVGALLAWRYLVATVLAERLQDGRLRPSDAAALARKLMFENGWRIYMHT